MLKLHLTVAENKTQIVSLKKELAKKPTTSSKKTSSKSLQPCSNEEEAVEENPPEESKAEVKRKPKDRSYPEPTTNHFKCIQAKDPLALIQDKIHKRQ